MIRWISTPPKRTAAAQAVQPSAAPVRAAVIRRPPPAPRASPPRRMTKTGTRPYSRHQIHRVAGGVAAAFGFTLDDLLGGDRHADLALARHVAWYLLRTAFKARLKETAWAFRRDHTSVLHGARRIAERVADDEALHQRVVELEATLRPLLAWPPPTERDSEASLSARSALRASIELRDVVKAPSSRQLPGEARLESRAQLEGHQAFGAGSPASIARRGAP